MTNTPTDKAPDDLIEQLNTKRETLYQIASRGQSSNLRNTAMSACRILDDVIDALSIPNSEEVTERTLMLKMMLSIHYMDPRHRDNIEAAIGLLQRLDRQRNRYKEVYSRQLDSQHELCDQLDLVTRQRDDLRNALEALVDLKEMKDNHGKPENYEELKANLWPQARKVLRAMEESK